MPPWLWLIVIAGLGYGLLEVGLRDRRALRHRTRRLQARASATGFSQRTGGRDRELLVLLAMVRALDRPGGIESRYDGMLADGTAVTVFEFVEGVGDDNTAPRIGFVLHYPTAWPTVEFAGSLSHHDGHDLATVLLSSEVCDYLARARDWVVMFSGGAVVGTTRRGGADDFDRVLRVADGVALRLPAIATQRWRADEAPPERRQAS